MAVCGMHVKVLALQLNMFRDCYGSQVNMILTWLPQTLWHSHICQKSPAKLQISIWLLSSESKKTLLFHSSWIVSCCMLTPSRAKSWHKLKTPNSHDLSHVGESLVLPQVISIMPKIPEISAGIQMERSVSVSSDRNIRDHLWRWSTHFRRNIPTEICHSIFDKPFLCPN